MPHPFIFGYDFVLGLVENIAKTLNRLYDPLKLKIVVRKHKKEAVVIRFSVCSFLYT